MKYFLKTFFIILIPVLGVSFFVNNYSSNSLSPIPETSSEISSKTIKIILVGDIMLDRGVEYMIKTQGQEDFRFPFLNITDYLKEADILFGNLESQISDKGTNVGSEYSFRADPAAIEGLTFAGFDILSVANNHAFDYTKEAFKDSLLRLEDEGINYVGGGFNEREAFSPVIKKINDTKIGFLSYVNLGPQVWRATEENSGIAWVDEEEIEKIKKDVEKAKENVDILIVSLHTGNEYSPSPTQFQVNFSKAVIDAGADLIVGHHPHVVQPNEKYKQSHIFYSLGNFIFDQAFSEETMQGQIVEVLIKNKEIKEIIPKEIKLNNFFQPALILDGI